MKGGSQKQRVRDATAGTADYFSSVDEDKREVHILAIGIKDRNRLLVGGKEFIL